MNKNKTYFSIGDTVKITLKNKETFTGKIDSINISAHECFDVYQTRLCISVNNAEAKTNMSFWLNHIENIKRIETNAVKKKQSDYPLPDETITPADMHAYGYHWDGMLPLTQKRAEELFAEMEIFCLYYDTDEGTEGVANSMADIKTHADHGGIFGVEKFEWQKHCPKKNI